MTKVEARKLLTRRLFTEYERSVSELIHAKALELSDVICSGTCETPERTLAIRKISEAVMYSSLGIAMSPLEPSASKDTA